MFPSNRTFARGHRGGYRGGRGGRNFQHAATAPLPKPEGSQRQLESIAEVAMMPGNCHDETKIKNVEYVTSFNWKDNRHPIILVPGK